MFRKVYILIFIIAVSLFIAGFVIYKSKTNTNTSKLNIPTTEQIQEKENGLQTIPIKPNLPQ